MNWPKATLANAITVALGSIVGLLFQDVFTAASDPKNLLLQKDLLPPFCFFA